MLKFKCKNSGTKRLNRTATGIGIHLYTLLTCDLMSMATALSSLWLKKHGSVYQDEWFISLTKINKVRQLRILVLFLWLWNAGVDFYSFFCLQIKNFAAGYDPYWSDSCSHDSHSTASTVAFQTAIQGHSNLRKRWMCVCFSSKKLQNRAKDNKFSVL